MKKMSLLLLLAVLSTIGSLGIAGASNGKACPPPTPGYPNKPPPGCGHSRPGQHPPATTCSQGGLGGSGTILNKDKNEDGQVSGPIHTQLEPAVDGLAPVVHEVNCDVVVSLGL